MLTLKPIQPDPRRPLDPDKNMPSTTTQRILAVAPGTRHLGLAFFEGEELVRFGIKTFEGRKTERTLLPQISQYLDELLEAHQPNILVVEDVFYAQARLSPLLRRLITSVKRSGRKKGLRIASYLPTTVKERLCSGKPTRRSLAEAMVRRYWFLYSFLKPGGTQLYWYQMFDAVALGVFAITDNRKALTIEGAARGEQPVRAGSLSRKSALRVAA